MNDLDKTAEYRPKKPAVRISALLIGMLAGMVILAVSIRFFAPAQFAEMKQRYEMWKSGARPVVPAEFVKGLEVDRCGTPPGLNCTCTLLVHGMGDSLATWRRLFTMDPGEWMKTQARVKLYAIDLPGTGGSPRPKTPDGYRVKNLAGAVYEFMRERPSCTKWVLVGNSFGGWVTSWIALDHPESVKAMLLIGSSGLKAGQNPAVAKLLAEPSIENLKEFQARMYYRPREYDESFWKAAVEKAKQGNSGDVIQAQTEADYLDASLKNLKTPALYLRGEADRIVEEATSQAVVRAAPGMKYEVVAQCGHVPQKECPHEVFSRILRLASEP